MFASKCIKQQQLKQNKLEKEMLASVKRPMCSTVLAVSPLTDVMI